MTIASVFYLKKKHIDVDILNPEFTAYSIYVSAYEDDVDEKEEDHMYQWLERNVTCPFIFIFACSDYLGMEESNRLTSLGVQFEHKIYGKNQAKENFYFVSIQSHEQLRVLLDEYYYLAEQNEFMMVADTQTLVEVKEYHISKTHCYPIVDCTLAENDGFAMIVGHDGRGFQLITTNKQWSGKNNLLRTLGDVHLEQWDDEYYGVK